MDRFESLKPKKLNKNSLSLTRGNHSTWNILTTRPTAPQLARNKIKTLGEYYLVQHQENNLMWRLYRLRCGRITDHISRLIIHLWTHVHIILLMFSWYLSSSGTCQKNTHDNKNTRRQAESCRASS
jgi:hypothetical protein